MAPCSLLLDEPLWVRGASPFQRDRAREPSRKRKKGSRRVTFCTKGDEVRLIASPGREEQVRENMARIMSNHQSVMRMFSGLYDIFADVEDAASFGADDCLNIEALGEDEQARANLARLSANHMRVMRVFRECFAFWSIKNMCLERSSTRKSSCGR
jgi:hypothetical protein